MPIFVIAGALFFLAVTLLVWSDFRSPERARHRSGTRALCVLACAGWTAALASSLPRTSSLAGSASLVLMVLSGGAAVVGIVGLVEDEQKLRSVAAVFFGGALALFTWAARGLASLPMS